MHLFQKLCEIFTVFCNNLIFILKGETSGYLSKPILCLQLLNVYVCVKHILEIMALPAFQYSENPRFKWMKPLNFILSC